MWIPKYIRCVNLFSHTDTTFVFIAGKMVMLLGVNKDDKGSNSNGSGKSTIIEAVTLAVTGDVFRGVGKDDYIKYGEPYAIVEFELENQLLNKIMYIKRKIFANTKSATLELTINGEKPKTVPTATSGGVDVKIGNKEIFTLLGISKDDFLNYYVIGQGNNKSFFTSNDTTQKEIISRFSNFTQIDALIGELEEKDDYHAKQMEQFNNRIATCDELIGFIDEQIADIQNNFKQEKLDKANEIKAEIAKLTTNINNGNRKLEEQSVIVTEKQYARDSLNLKLKDVTKIEQEIEQVKTDLRTLEQEMRDTNKYLNQLHGETGKVIECPKCLTKFIPSATLSVDDLLQTITATTLLVENQGTQITALELRITTLKNSLLDNNEKRSKIRTLNSEINSTLHNSAEVLTNLDLWEEMKVEANDRLKAVLKMKADDSLKSLCAKKEVELSKKQEFIDKHLEHLQARDENAFHLFHFGKKGFKTFLANKSIKTIQDICNFYLQKFETNLQVSISGYKVLSSGEVRDKIQINVMKDGVNKGLFNKYSGGEKSRVNICGIISINRLINNTSPTGGLDLLILDENVSYLDATGQEEVIKILSKSKVTSILVMHNVDTYPYKYKFTVTKQDGESKITQ